MVWLLANRQNPGRAAQRHLTCKHTERWLASIIQAADMRGDHERMGAGVVVGGGR
jgi:hypothetical protein